MKSFCCILRLFINVRLFISAERFALKTLYLVFSVCSYNYCVTYENNGNLLMLIKTC